MYYSESSHGLPRRVATKKVSAGASGGEYGVRRSQSEVCEDRHHTVEVKILRTLVCWKGQLVSIRLLYQSTRLSWLIWIDIFSARLTESIQFLFQVNCLVTESIRFHKVGDWVDWLFEVWLSQLNWFKIPQKANEIEHFPKRSTKSNVFQKRPTKYRIFQKKVNIHIELIDLIESFGSFFWLDWVDSYVLSNIIELIDIFELYRFMVIESIPIFAY